MSWITEPSGAEAEWVFAVCDKCGQRDHIAVGYRLDEITFLKRLDCAKKIGWEVAPRMLCRRCVWEKKLQS